MSAFASQRAFVDYVKQMVASIESNIDFTLEHLEARSKLCVDMAAELDARDVDLDTWVAILKFLLSTNDSLRSKLAALDPALAAEHDTQAPGVLRKVMAYLAQLENRESEWRSARSAPPPPSHQ